MYDYLATVLRVVDADTFHLEIDPGLDLRVRITGRLYAVNAPERSTPEGKAATEFVAHWIATNADVSGGTMRLNCRTIKDRKEKYGRYLVRLYSSDWSKELTPDLVAYLSKGE